jgi:DNA-binding Lrp family transcriptional regulator
MAKAFVMIDVAPGHEEACQQRIQKMAGVQLIYQVTGVHDMIALVDAEPYEKLAVIIGKIRKLEWIRATDTELVIC